MLARSSARLLKGKEIRFEDAARVGMLAGVTKLCRAVQTTLGPRGRNVTIQQAYGGPKITKDGVTVAKAVEFTDKFEDMGAQLVRQAATNTNDVAGDGTTTATVLATAIAVEGHRVVATGSNPIEVKRGIDAAVKTIVANLEAQAKKIQAKEEIQQVAVISANGDQHIGKLIADAMEKVGTNGVITAEDNKQVDTVLNIVEGFSFDKGYVSPYFVTNAKTQKTEYENPWILVSTKKISTVHEILPCLNYVVRSGRPLVIVADDIESEALTTLILNRAAGKLQVVAVKAPSFGDQKAAILQDIATYTGAQLVSDDAGVELAKRGDEFDPTILGSAKKVTVSKDQTIVLGGIGGQEAVQERVDVIKALIAKSESEYEKEQLKGRLAKLSGGVAVIKVGGASEVEVQEKKDRVVDALNATRAAAAEGIVAGAGLALLHASISLDKLLDSKDLTAEQKTGVRIVQHAIRKPAQGIIDNAGQEGTVLVYNMLEKGSPSFGYDCVSGKWVDFFQAGIIDPLLVVKTGLLNAASVASMLLTTEAAIVDAPEPKTPAAGAAGMAGGMGGMGGMDDF